MSGRIIILFVYGNLNNLILIAGSLHLEFMHAFLVDSMLQIL